MTTRQFALVWLLLLPLAVKAQPQHEVNNIMQLCGCYDVTFQYTETFRTDSNYQFHDDKIAHARELILPIENKDGKISLQHMLLVNENYIIKHWREDWTYEQPTILQYKGNKTWTKETLQPQQVKGKWAQTVWQVDDIPRYGGYSSWIDNDNKIYWESTAYAPLPRREYTKRKDYNIMLRTNRIVTTDKGWVHEQDNQKIIRKGKQDSLLVSEKGLNTYVKIDDSHCAKAKLHWAEHIDFWKVVRAEWARYIDSRETLALHTTVEDKRLFEYFYELEYSWKEEQWNNKQLSKKIKETMSRFVIQ
ncbi:MAG: DUF6607 family protein [Flavipsychrobacter sp.]